MSKGRSVHGGRFIESLESRQLLATIQGTVFTDSNYTGNHQGAEYIDTQTRVYLDLNDNGAWDSNERSAFGSGYGFSLASLPAGTYRVRTVPRAGSTWTSHPNNAAIVVTVAQNDTIRTDDIGIAPVLPAGTIQGFVYNDLNQNGKPDPGSLDSFGLSYVFLDLNDNAVRDQSEPIASPDQWGSFVFANRSPGTYVLRTMSEYPAFNPASGKIIVTLPSGSVVTGVGFGHNGKAVSHFSGSLFKDANLDGIRQSTESTIISAAVYADLNNNAQLDDTDVLANNNTAGGYTLYGLGPGTYTIRSLGGTDYIPSGSGVASVTVPANGYVTRDFGFVSATTGTVTGTLYGDGNQNGRKDADETAYAGYPLTVYIDANNNAALDTNERSYSVTGATFGFTDLAAGTYTLRVRTDAWHQVTDPAVQSRTITVTPGQIAATTFGIRQTYTLYASVHDDLNGNAKTETGEPSISGRTVFLDLDGDNTLDSNEPSQVTSSTGLVAFTGIVPGAYRLRTVLPAGWRSSGYEAILTAAEIAPSFANDGILVLPASWRFEVIRLFALHTQISPVYDYTVLGTVFNDANGNGIKDVTDVGIAGRTLYIDANNNSLFDSGERSSMSIATGAFGFNAFTAGTYVLRQVLPAGWEQTAPTTPYSFTVAGPNASSVNFGSRQIPATTTTVTLQAENATLAGGTVKASNNAGFTGSGFADYAGQNSSATFTLTRSASGAATLTFRYANGSTANRPLQILVNNVVVGTVACAPTGAWTTWKTVALTNTNLPAGAVAIKAIASTSVGGANVDSLTVTAGGTVTPPPPPPPPTTGSISGVLFMDANKNGIFDGSDYYLKDKLVFIDLDGDNAPDSNEKQLLSDSSGKFTFSGLAAGTYKIRRVVPSGYKQTSPLLNVTLTAGQNVSGLKIITVVA